MVVLDTTFLIHLLRNTQNAGEKLSTLSEPFCTTRINLFEVLKGVYLKNSEEKESALSIFKEFIKTFKVLELDASSTHIAAIISAELRKKGETVDSADLLIAGIALSNGENRIVTQNVKDFSKIPHIQVENY